MKPMVDTVVCNCHADHFCAPLKVRIRGWKRHDHGHNTILTITSTLDLPTAAHGEVPVTANYDEGSQPTASGDELPLHPVWAHHTSCSDREKMSSFRAALATCTRLTDVCKLYKIPASYSDNKGLIRPFPCRRQFHPLPNNQTQGRQPPHHLP